jgi:hypothetical protein
MIFKVAVPMSFGHRHVLAVLHGGRLAGLVTPHDMQDPIK